MGVWVGDHYCEVDCPPCGLFEGRSGKAVVLTLTFLAFVTYVSIFTIRKRSGKDTRSWKVFWLDLMKMGIGQGCAWGTLRNYGAILRNSSQLFSPASSSPGINVLNSHRNSEMAAGEGESFDAVSWYFPTFLNDELIAVPLGVGLWQLLTRVVRSCSTKHPELFCLQMLAHSGKYAPVDEESGKAVGRAGLWAANLKASGGTVSAANAAARGVAAAADAAGEVRYSWWLVQLTFWVLCVIASRCAQSGAIRRNSARFC